MATRQLSSTDENVFAIEYKHDPPFRRLARKKQSDFREKVLKVGFDPTDPRAVYGNLLTPEDAAKGLIFYKGFLRNIIEVKNQRYGHGIGMLMRNLLRSEHIPLNIFVPMLLDKIAAANVFNAVLGTDEIAQINISDNYKVIEYAPPTKADYCYLGDKTSFDVYFRYFNHSGEPCGLGIEVKYAEESYKLKRGSKEENDVKLFLRGDKSSSYRSVTDLCGYYKPNTYNELVKDDFRQVWRNHILGASMVLHGDIKSFTSIHLYPSGNTHFARILPSYRELMTDIGNETFVDLTYERLFYLLRKQYTTKEFLDWIQYLENRYIVR